MIDRRSVLAAAASLGLSALGLPLRALGAVSGLKLGKPQPFSFDALVQEMQQQAATAYVPEKSLPQGVLDRIGYDEHGKLKFNPDYALFRDGPGQYPVTFFALGKYFRTPVHMFVLSAAGEAANAAQQSGAGVAERRRVLGLPIAGKPAGQCPKPRLAQ